MEEKKLTEKESIELIASMIERTRERYMGGGSILLMWGYLTVAVAALVWVVIAATGNPAWNWLWFLIWIVGGTVSPIMARRQQARYGVKSYSDKLTSQLWSVVGYSALVLTACCLGMMMLRGVNSWAAWLLFALIIVPFAEIAQGIVVKEKCLVAGGAAGLAAGLFTACCIAGRVELYITWFMPLFIIAFVCMMIVPGHILNRKSARQ